MHEEQRAIEQQLHADMEALLRRSGDRGDLETLRRLGPDLSPWIGSPELEQFMKTLHELSVFHVWHGEIRETVIGYDALNSYLIVTSALREMIANEEYTAQRERISEDLDYTQTTLKEIIAEGYAKSYYDEEESAGDTDST